MISAGCEDDAPTIPDEEENGSEDHTVIIDQTPDTLTGAGWSLTGPKTETGSGDTTFTEMPTGTYVLLWDEVVGYITPPRGVEVLDDDGSITFSGTYVREVGKGTIIIDQTPDILAGAGWTLTGPKEATGSGDAIRTEMQEGTYTLTWDGVSGYLTPGSDTQMLLPDSVITFRGTYEPFEGFVLIPAGTFLMGSPSDEYGRSGVETQHTVTLTTPFHMHVTEVTNQQYADLAQWAYDNGHCMASSSSLNDLLDGAMVQLMDLGNPYCEISFDGGIFSVDAGKEDYPVIYVTWFGAVAYCDWLSLREWLERAYDHSTFQCNGHDPYGAEGYRLPTEAEWEYACRAGTETPFTTGECLDAGTEANYDGNYPYLGCPSGPNVEWTEPVGSYTANAWGLYDMHGNVYELCNDWYALYDGDDVDPVGPIDTDLEVRMIRGGFWYLSATYCRSASREHYDPSAHSAMVGFRPVRSAE